jgi:ribosomal protein S18 acetylase RimI-like enzyme
MEKESDEMPISQYFARPMNPSDWDGIWAVLEPSIRDGDWFPIPQDFTSEDTQRFWCADGHDVFVGEDDGEIVWTYYTCPIQLGGGAHIANAGYAVSHARFGRGLGRTMLLHSLDSTRAAGYRAMQFQTVLSSNERAVRLYANNGFEVRGRVPEGYLHPTLGYVDTLIMHRRL